MFSTLFILQFLDELNYFRFFSSCLYIYIIIFIFFLSSINSIDCNICVFYFVIILKFIFFRLISFNFHYLSFLNIFNYLYIFVIY